MQNSFAIVATRTMQEYAEKVVQKLIHFPSFTEHSESISRVDTLKVSVFADGELEVSVDSSLRGQDVYLFANAARNMAGIPVEEAKIELYHAVDALKRSQAERIIVFEPYVSCSRSDRTTRRNSVGLWIHFKILAALGTQHIITYQLHSDKSKSMVDPTICAIDDVPGLTLLKKHLCDTYIQTIDQLYSVVKPQWAFCSVDAGGEKLARSFANAFGAPLVVAHKQRDYSKVNTVESINILSAEPIKGKTLWIVDDMVDTAGSVYSLIKTLANLEPAEINLLAVHAVFSPPALDRLTELSKTGLLKHIMVTDTVFCPECFMDDLPNLEIVPSTELSAQIIATIAEDKSLGNLLKPFNAEEYLRRPKLL
ncbi:MAG TPA: ribose-phosphate diphosphokinase [Treponema sp.]|nr:ribose-phosphate diphosphokinase [Treponema sp.]HPC70451.1 ribose-phosphate diphosphokinase [Treponema sp.]HRS02998.1 ribose-phosphate diphosphokinase [Treponema sp.]HRU27728.1 ribose-phosphate diphosphokinase [Treponema sp.]